MELRWGIHNLRFVVPTTWRPPWVCQPYIVHCDPILSCEKITKKACPEFYTLNLVSWLFVSSTPQFSHTSHSTMQSASADGLNHSSETIVVVKWRIEPGYKLQFVDQTFWVVGPDQLAKQAACFSYVLSCRSCCYCSSDTSLKSARDRLLKSLNRMFSLRMLRRGTYRHRESP